MHTHVHMYLHTDNHARMHEHTHTCMHGKCDYVFKRSSSLFIEYRHSFLSFSCQEVSSRYVYIVFFLLGVFHPTLGDKGHSTMCRVGRMSVYKPDRLGSNLCWPPAQFIYLWNKGSLIKLQALGMWATCTDVCRTCTAMRHLGNASGG